ncbi:MAG: hypothetical protein IJ458_03855 [Clostridia bacterium]|nr:hypothetical protein [Clostridia bacterium]
MKILVKSDVFDICNRIKKFDSNYCIVFNNVSNKYEVYSAKLTDSVDLISGRVLSYICTLPYDCLDARSIKYLYDTSVENIDDIITQIDKQNKELERQNELKLKQQSLIIAEHKLRQLT